MDGNSKITSAFMKSTIFLLIVILIATGCTKKDCSSIDLATLSDIKLSPKVPVQATSFEEFMAELDRYVHRTHKLIMRCRTENDFQRDKVLPGVMLWISDSWDLRSDTSKLGRLLHERGVDPWERTRVAGVLYHRHLNDLDLQINSVLGDAQVGSEYKGRVRSQELLMELDEKQRTSLLAKVRGNDELTAANNSFEVSLSAIDRKKNSVEGIVAGRYQLMELLNSLMYDVQQKASEEKDLAALAEAGFGTEFRGFSAMKRGNKLIVLETVRQSILENEKKLLNQSIGPASKKQI